VFLTGDIRSASLSELALPDSARLAKPTKAQELLQAVRQFLAGAPVATPA
jgi:hypothetical protein